MPSMKHILKNLTLLQCINHIIRYNLPRQAIVYSEIDLGKIQFPRVITNLSTPLTSGMPTKSIDVIVARYFDRPDMNTLFEISGNYSNFDTDTWYLLIGTNFTLKNLERLRQNYIFKFVLLDVHLDMLFTVHPSQNIITQRKNGISLHEIGSCKNTHSIFRNQSPIIWKNTTVQLLFHPTFPFCICPRCAPAGVEIDILETIFDVLDVTPKYERVGNHVLWDDLSKKSDYDVYFGGIAAREPIDEYLFPYVMTDVYFIVPSPKKLMRWKYIFRVFSWEIYFLYFITLISISWIESLRRRRQRFRRILRMMKISFKLLLDQSVVSRFVFQRWLLFLITIVTFFLNASFKCGFTYFITGVNFEKGIESIEDVINSELQIGATPQMAMLLKKSQVESRFLDTRLVICRILQNCLNRTAFTRNLIVARPYITFKAIRKTYMDKDGRDLIQAVKTAYMGFHVSARVPRGHPLYSIMNTYCQRMVEHGLVEKIILKYIGSEVDIPILRHRRLTFAQISFAVGLWIVGVVSGCIVLLIEIFREYLKRNNLKKIIEKKAKRLKRKRNTYLTNSKSQNVAQK